MPQRARATASGYTKDTGTPIMTSQKNTNKCTKSKWRLALSAGILSSAISLPAAAADVTAIHAQVEYGSLLMVQLTSINYVAQSASPGCSIPANTADTLKIWVNLSQAALLSSKNLKVYFTSCSGTNYIRDLVLIR
jgi:hypothetical protein